MESRIWKMGDDVDTDQIIGTQYLLLPTISEMTAGVFESLDPAFAKECRPGDVIVAGNNFGCGSSREQAPRVLKEMGIKAVIAASFARIFFRNAINIGLPVIIQKELHKAVEHKDTLVLEKGAANILYKGKEYLFEAYPEYITKIIESGGLLNYVNSL